MAIYPGSLLDCKRHLECRPRPIPSKMSGMPMSGMQAHAGMNMDSMMSHLSEMQNVSADSWRR